MATKRKIIILLSACAGAAIAFMLNFWFLENLIIPDPCYYHNNNAKPGWLFYLFYEITSAQGDHPSPTLFNIVFTLLIGGLAGLGLSVYKTKKH